MVHTPSSIVKFLPHSHGLHSLDLKYATNKEMMLVTAVYESYQGFIKKEIE